MSKFCGIISKHLNSEDAETMCFSHLEMLTNWLASETESLESDFQIKGEAVKDQQLQVMQNENKLIEMHHILEELKQKIAATEQEVELNDTNIKTLERNIKALEDYAKGSFTTVGIACGCPPVCRQHEQHNMLRLLQDTDRTMTELDTLTSEMQELGPYMGQISNPYNTISNILDCHVTTLRQTEKNLNCLADKMNAVDGMFQLMMKHLAASRQNKNHSAKPNFNKATGGGHRNIRFLN